MVLIASKMDSSISQQLYESCKTLLMFGKDDVVGVTLPTIAVALVLNGSFNSRSLVEGLVWFELHLLTFQVGNQICGLEEDRVAKPHRPLPSGRISLENAKYLYYCLFLAIWISSIYSGTVLCTLLYSVAIVGYNEGGLAAVPVFKNFLGAFGLACYCWGTTIIFDQGNELHGLKGVAVFMMGAVFATTGHAQDFRDRSADAKMGRRTIPRIFSQPVARWSLAALIAAWTLGLIALWKPPVAASIVFGALALRTLFGFLSSYDEKDDSTSYIFYGFWLLGSNLLPVFPRLRGEF